MKTVTPSKIICTLSFIIAATFCAAQVETFYVQLVQLDQNYSSEEDSITISRNPTEAINKLYLYLGGTNSSSSTAYNAVRLHAANLGFDFVNLAYPNTVPAASLATDTDNLAFDKYRQEICFGTPVSENVTVDSLNSIATRTLKLLQYLDTTYPTENWDQYLTNADQIDWTNVVIGGHSQGAGHAAYLAKNFAVDRVLMFAGPNDYSSNFSNAANWLSQPGATSTDRHFAYLSLNDEVVAFSKQYANLAALGMTAAYDSTAVDDLEIPFENSNLLYTTQPPGIVLLDHNVPIKLSSKNGDVWTYMLTKDIATSIHQKHKSVAVSVYPNPTSGTVTVTVSRADIEKLTVYDYVGQMLLTVSQTAEVDFSELSVGVYFLHVEFNNGQKTVQQLVKN